MKRLNTRSSVRWWACRVSAEGQTARGAATRVQLRLGATIALTCWDTFPIQHWDCCSSRSFACCSRKVPYRGCQTPRSVNAYVKRSDASDLLRYCPVLPDWPTDVLNYIFHMGDHHRFMLDQENLAHHCREAGFERCAAREFDPNVDSAARDYESLYMVCNRPTAS